MGLINLEEGVDFEVKLISPWARLIGAHSPYLAKSLKPGKVRC